jgi:hypothetical protein
LAEKTKDSAAAQPKDSAAQSQPKINWNVDNLKSSYVNFANANSSRDEVVLNFGVNNSWDRMVQEVDIDLEHRIVMSPFAAKRLSDLLLKLLAEYEGRYGEVK